MPPDDLLALPVDTLRHRFSDARGRVVVARVLRAAIRQVVRQNREAAAAGLEPAFKGHGRALWHSLPEQLLARLDALGGSDPYKRMVEVLSEMVFVRRELVYSELELTDQSWEERRIGDRHPAIIVIAEKRSCFRLLRRVHEARGVTVLATPGFASGVTSELTARHVLAGTGGVPGVAVVGLTDYGPSSWVLLDAFCRQLEHFGLEVRRRETVFHPDQVPASLLRLAARPLPASPNRRKIAARWMAETGGIGGEPLRVDMEVLAPEVLERLVLEAVDRAAA